MKKNIIWLSLLLVTVFLVAACPPAPKEAKKGGEEPKPEKEVGKTEIKTALATLEKGAYDAWMKKDGKFFEGFLAANFVENGPEGPVSGKDVAKTMSEDKCDVKSHSFSDEEATEISSGVMLYTKKDTIDATCDGKPFPSPQWSASLYVKDGDKWAPVFHQSVASQEAMDAMKKAATDGDETAKKEEKEVAKVAETEKAKPADEKKADEKKADEKTAAKPEAKTAEKAESQPADKKEAGKEASPDADLVATISAIDKKFWEAWEKKDGKAAEENLTEGFMEIGPKGRTDMAATVKMFAENKCEVKSQSQTDYKVTKINDSLAILTYKANVDATCDGKAEKGAMWSSGVFVKDGDSWKGAFYMSTPAA